MIPTDAQLAQNVWTPELISAITSGVEKILLAFLALAGGIVGLYLQLRNNRKQGERVGAERDEKLDTVVAQGNGQMAAALARIATLEAMLAKESGRADNRVRQIGAEAEAELHREATTLAHDILKEPLAVLKEPLLKVKTAPGGPDDSAAVRPGHFGRQKGR